MKADIFDGTTCALGEGPLWHPEAKALYWFDILGSKLYRKRGEATVSWTFDRYASAAGWISETELLVATATGLIHFDTSTGQEEILVPLEADNPKTRSNDGRADPMGGFWIGTMGTDAASGGGAIYRYHKGELRKLCERVTIPNSIAFHPDGCTATWADSADGRVWKQALDGDGWPQGEPELFLDFRGSGLIPDGAVFDAEGGFWVAQWGSFRAARYVDGALERVVETRAAHTSCPAFGGEHLTTLYLTTAQENLTSDELMAQPHAGAVFVAETGIRGQAEHRVIL